MCSICNLNVRFPWSTLQCLYWVIRNKPKFPPSRRIYIWRAYMCGKKRQSSHSAAVSRARKLFNTKYEAHDATKRRHWRMRQLRWGDRTAEPSTRTARNRGLDPARPGAISQETSHGKDIWPGHIHNWMNRNKGTLLTPIATPLTAVTSATGTAATTMSAHGKTP